MGGDARGVGLVEWAGWEDFSSALAKIVAGTKDPAFEPRSIQKDVAQASRGAVRAGVSRKEDVLKSLKMDLSPQDLPEAPALRSAISRRARLALACLVDAIAAEGLGPNAGPDAMGLVGQLPRATFGLIFDKVDDRDRGACAFLGEMLDTWDKRRCFSKKWLGDARSKFSVPRGANQERDEGRGWYGVMAENLHKKPRDDPPGSKREGEDFDEVKKARSRSPRRKSDRTKEVLEAPSMTAEQKLAALVKGGSGRIVDADVVLVETHKKKGGKKKLGEDEDGDEAVAKQLEASRKRRAELMEKYKA